jgi:hypothetical protein
LSDNLRAEAVVNNGALFHSDEVTFNSVLAHMPISKIAYGALDSATIVTTTDGFPVQFVANSTVAATNAGTFVVQENGGALTALQLIDNIVLAEDAAHASGDPGVQMLAVRKDTAASLAGTDGDYQPLITDSTGKLHVNVGNTVTVGSHAVTNAGTFAVQVDGAALTSLQLIDDAIYADDAGFTLASSKVIATGAIRDDSLSSLAAAESDVVPLRVGSTGALWVGVSGTAAVTQSGTWNVGTVTTVTTVSTVTNVATIGTSVTPGTSAAHLGKAEDAAHASGDTGVYVLAVRDDTLGAHSGTDGDYESLHTNANGALWTIDVNSASALTALQLLDDAIFTDDAAFTPGSSKLIVVGAQCDDDSTDSVNEGDAGALRMTLERKLRVVSALDSAAMQSGNDQVTPKFAIIDAATMGDNTIVAAVASKKIRVLAGMLVSSGTTTARFESGAGGTALTGQMNLVANSVMPLAFSPVGHFETAAATLLNLELSAAVSVDGWIVYIECD